MYKCSFCGYSFNIIGKYNTHLYLHRFYGGRTPFKCLYNNCFLQFKRYSAFHTHVVRSHPKKNKTLSLLNVKNGSNYFYRCNFVESCFNTQCFKVFKLHIYQHIRKKEFLKCPLAELCESNTLFSTMTAIRTHFFRKHAHVTVSLKDNTKNEPNATNSDNQDIPFDESSEETDKTHHDFNDDKDIEELGLRLLSRLYLTLEAKFFVSKMALQNLVTSLADLNTLNASYIKNKLASLGHSLSQCDLPNDIFFRANNPENGSLKSNIAREIFYKNNFNYIAPVKIDLKDNNLESFFYYVPILETLKLLLKNKNVLEQCLSSHLSQNKNILYDIVDGKCTNTAFWLENKNGLKLILYQDSFEICNPLGSSKKKHKILGIYMTVANLNPWQRSKVDQIQLVALCYERDIKHFGFTKIFKVIVEDIKYLEIKGLDVNDTINLKGSLLAVVGDNLGSHQIGGFLESFNVSTHFCRFCFKNDGNFINTNKIDYRTAESYAEDVDFALSTGEVYRGIKNNSVLNSLNYFHVCNPGLSPCIAHDLFEGVVQYDLILVLNKLVSDKIISYQYVNENIKNIKFSQGYNKIGLPEIKKHDKLGGTATQNMYLLNIIPFALLSKIPDLSDNEYWKMILTLRKICNITLALQVSLDQVAILKYLIEEYLEYRARLFENIPLKPKHHYMSHYAFLTLHFGPLRHLWTLRFESKHSYFKNCIRHSPNFKNVLYSLTKKHQLLQCLNESQEGVLFNEKAIVTDEKIYTNLLSKDGSIIYESKEINYRGITYSVGMYVCADKNQYNIYSVCKIDLILLDKNFENIKFKGQKKYIAYDPLSGLFTINIGPDSNSIFFVEYNNLLNVEPLIHSKINNQDFFYFKSSATEFY